MAALEELKLRLAEVQEELSDEYFVFIAPDHNRYWESLDVGDWVFEKSHLPDALLKSAGILDIFAITIQDIAAMGRGKQITFLRPLSKSTEY